MLVLNDCITDTMRHSTRSTGLLFCIKFELNLHCIKEQLENTIEKLTNHIARAGASDATRIRLAVAHVSRRDFLKLGNADQ